MEGIYVVAREPAVITMSGSTFQPKLAILSKSGWYFPIFLFIVSVEKRSLQYVNSINWMVISGLGVFGGDCPCGMPRTQRRSGLNLALQWQRFVLHVHGNSHEGSVFSGGLF